jgi:hypothetical protein
VALCATLAIVVGAAAMAIGFGVVSAVCYWQLGRWQASPGHPTFSRAFASEAAEQLDVARLGVLALTASFFVVLGIVIPAIAIFGITT